MKFLPVSIAFLALFSGSALAVSEKVQEFIGVHSREFEDQLEATIGVFPTLVAPHLRNAYGAMTLLGIVKTEIEDIRGRNKQPSPELTGYLENVVKAAIEPLITVLEGEHRVVGALFDVSIHLAGEPNYDVQKRATFDQMKGWVKEGMDMRQYYLNVVEKEKTRGNQGQFQQRQPKNVAPKNVQVPPKNVPQNNKPAPPQQNEPKSPTFEELIEGTNVSKDEAYNWFKAHGWKSDSDTDSPLHSPFNFGNDGDRDMQPEHKDF